MGAKAPIGMRSEQRFTELYELHHSDVMRYCLRRTTREDAKDVAAEVFAVTWRRIDEVPESDALPWLYRTAGYTLANHRRSTRRRLNLATKLGVVVPSTVPGPETQIVRKAEDAEVIGALARLRPDDREILTLSGWEELTAAQIAERFEVSVAAAEKRLARAKARFAKVLPSPSTTPPMQEGGNR